MATLSLIPSRYLQCSCCHSDDMPEDDILPGHPLVQLLLLTHVALLGMKREPAG